MSENTNSVNTPSDTVETENKRESYPIKTFKWIEPFIGNVYKKYGSEGLHSNEKIADANNLSVNSIKQIVSTGTQYGCFIKVHGKGYQISEVFTKIFHPENSDEKRILITDCLKNVPFYAPLFTDYNEKVVPSIEGLQNRFIRDFKMKTHLARNAAEIFTQNLKDFDLINSRNVLILPNENSGNNSKQENNVGSEQKNTFENTPPVDGNESPSVTIPIKLKGNRMASLSFPLDFSDEDLTKLFKVAKAYIEAYGENIDLSKI